MCKTIPVTANIQVRVNRITFVFLRFIWMFNLVYLQLLKLMQQ
jgi:hypothetical protein